MSAMRQHVLECMYGCMLVCRGRHHYMMRRKSSVGRGAGDVLMHAQTATGRVHVSPGREHWKSVGRWLGSIQVLLTGSAAGYVAGPSINPGSCTSGDGVNLSVLGLQFKLLLASLFACVHVCVVIYSHVWRCVVGGCV
ncbi:hypothetical protein COO60DRAFT_786148 [Scenedesmus sp. NREL 46B-D3]|nr:hypothetical protein COO60DRAFT_786148 [Scenedesmus sp. NREL 46B-D3]